MSRHKMRTFLTMLGVIIGVASVVMMATLGTSVKGSIISNFDILQPDMMTISAAKKAGAGIGGGLGGGGGAGAQSGLFFTEYDVEAIRGMTDYVSLAIPSGSIQVISEEFNGTIRTTIRSLTATTTDANTFSADFESGSVFSKGKRECVLGYDVARMFGDNATVPLKLGDLLTFRLANGTTVNATVSGVLNKSTDMVSRFMQIDTTVYVPIDPFYGTTVKSPHTNESARVFGSLAVKAKDVGKLEKAQNAVLDYLNGNESDARRLLASEYEFRASTQESTAKQISSMVDMLTLFIGAIAAISLIVGSIGVANIMLVTVTERTREIGIMKAVGAKSRDILQIFLTESMLMGLMGSVAGCIIGPTMGYLVVKFLLDVPVSFDYTWFAVSVLVGISVGVIAGYYPARKATKVDPIVALRYE
ncbi:MAG: ABC transporter permease [Candidatus Thermoplasmatota archaeon]|nr:ABC transporter permease [Candidatus Thermoplasmatota archaeon]